jgi:hypothetical protein
MKWEWNWILNYFRGPIYYFMLTVPGHCRLVHIIWTFCCVLIISLKLNISFWLLVFYYTLWYNITEVLSTDHELIPARNASLAAVHGSASGTNVVRYQRTWKHIRPSKKEMNKAVTILKLPGVCSLAINHCLSLSLTNRKSPVHLLALYSPRTAQRTFAARRDQHAICGQYAGITKDIDGTHVARGLCAEIPSSWRRCSVFERAGSLRPRGLFPFAFNSLYTAVYSMF